jgi:hypothetical protein
MPIEKSKFILDTNVWISFLIKRNFVGLDKLLYDDSNKLIFSHELLDEFLEVVRRKKFQKIFSPQEIEIALEIIIDFTEWVELKTVVEICRDPKDNFLLGLAIDSRADFLVTGDKDLLVLENIGQTRIITVSDFMDL